MTPSEQITQRAQRRSRLPRAKRLTTRASSAALTLLALLALGLGIFELIVWNEPVDSYTYVAFNEQRQMIATTTAHDARAANALRQRINTNDAGLPFVTTPLAGCGDAAREFDTPAVRYTYTFFAGGRSVETVQIDGPCGGGSASCGGVIVGVNGVAPLTLGRKEL